MKRGVILALVLCALAHFRGMAQGIDPITVSAGRTFLSINIHSLDKYDQRLQRTQKHLLQKLKRKEARLAAKLKRTDSAAYARLKANPLTYDSIGRLAAVDSSAMTARLSRKSNPTIDSLRGVASFLQGGAQKATALTGSSSTSAITLPELGQYNSELTKLQGELNYREYINGLISQKTASLSNLNSGSAASNIPVVGSIAKEVLYAKGRMKAWEALADNPSAAEAKALELLQGTPGFEEKISATVNGSGMGGMNGATTSEDLEKMGYQTRRQMAAQLQQRFGSSLGAVQGQMGSQVNAWQGKAQGAIAQVKDTKNSVQSAKDGLKSGFKPNPMRSLPFWQRIEKSYSVQTARASADGTKPAMLEIGGMAGYRQTATLSAGVGIALNTGLGQDWSHIRFSFQGLGLRSYVQWKGLPYGFGLYGGYERTYKGYAFTGTNTSNPGTELTSENVHNTAVYSDAVVVGLTKSYKINAKWNGAIQLLYDIWWKEKNLNSPFILRFITQSK